MQRFCACGKEVIGRRVLCDECRSVYGAKASEWPAWLRFWVNDNAREIRDERRIDEHEVSFTDYGIDKLV